MDTSLITGRITYTLKELSPLSLGYHWDIAKGAN